MKKRIKLSQYAKLMSVTYRTAQNWYYEGKIDNTVVFNGRIYVEIDEQSQNNSTNDKVVLYARVSSHDQKDDLTRQIERLKIYANAKGYQINKVYSEIASGMNDNRKQLNSLLNDKDVKKVLIVSKDRLTRFGFNYIFLLLNRLNIEIEILDVSESDDENLMDDFISIITSFCAKIYGKRSGKNKTKQLIEQL